MIQNLRAIRVLQAAGLALAAALLPAAGCDDIGSGDQIGTHTIRLSLTKAGRESSGPSAGSTSVSLSGDGRFAAFQSDMTGLINGDGNGFQDIFVKDRSDGTVEIVSRNTTTLAASFNHSRLPAISADGSIVAFASAGGLASGAGVTKDHLYVHNRTTHVTSRVLDPAINPSVIAGVQGFFAVSISDDGTKVAFSSSNTNLAAGLTVAGTQVYVADLTTTPSTITLVSRSSAVATTGANADCVNPRISGDGLSVVFQSTASNLIATATPPTGVYLGSSSGAVCQLASLTNAGANPGGNNTLPSVSRDGRYVSFLTDSTLIAPAIPGVAIAVRDRTAGTTTVVSIDSTGAFVAGDQPVISPDGSRIAFTGLPLGGAGFVQIWTRDLLNNVSSVASVHLTGALADADCFRPAFSGDSAWLGWDTAATNLVTSDGNGQSDIFVRGPLTR